MLARSAETKTVAGLAWCPTRASTLAVAGTREGAVRVWTLGSDPDQRPQLVTARQGRRGRGEGAAWGARPLTVLGSSHCCCRARAGSRVERRRAALAHRDRRTGHPCQRARACLTPYRERERKRLYTCAQTERWGWGSAQVVAAPPLAWAPDGHVVQVAEQRLVEDLPLPSLPPGRDDTIGARMRRRALAGYGFQVRMCIFLSLFVCVGPRAAARAW
jgi:hypothetical protein